MLDNAFLSSLPDDDTLAFFVIEEEARKIVERSINSESSPVQDNLIRRRYISTILAASQEYNILDFSDFRRTSDTADDFQYLAEKTDEMRVRHHIRSSKRSREYSVQLDQASRAQIEHHISSLKAAVAVLDLTDAKRSAIEARIAALESELTRSRTRLEVLGALMIVTAEGLGSATEKLEPVWRAIERIAGVFGKSKQGEKSGGALPPPAETKRIEGPRKKLPAPKDEA